MDGYLLIDKPEGWTSFDVVAKVRSLARKSTHDQSKKRVRVGHAGTLDPFATGLLIVLVGAATKQQESFMKKYKTYSVLAKLGATSDTDDRDGTIVASEVTNIPDKALVEKVLQNFVGEFLQTPPEYSAIKVDGKRAYALARKGAEVKLKKRRVAIHNITNIEYTYPYVRFVVSVSSGTYIRSLVRDVGQQLGSGAYTDKLRRLTIGDFKVTDAARIEHVMECGIEKYLVSLGEK
jgi:tRNA pseudouridine55 synthase